MNLEALKVFCKECMEANKDQKFVIAKYSADMPYWAVFSVVMVARKKTFAGHCFANELNLEDVLDLVYSYDCKVEIQNKYMF